MHVEINPKTVLEALTTGDPRELGTRIITAFLHYPPAEAELRGALVTSQLLGVVIGRYVLGTGHLPALEPAFLIATVGRTLQRYLTGELPEAFS